jgi:hypothetical protein
MGCPGTPESPDSGDDVAACGVLSLSPNPVVFDGEYLAGGYYSLEVSAYADCPTGVATIATVSTDSTDLYLNEPTPFTIHVGKSVDLTVGYVSGGAAALSTTFTFVDDAGLVLATLQVEVEAE